MFSKLDNMQLRIKNSYWIASGDYPTIIDTGHVRPVVEKQVTGKQLRESVSINFVNFLTDGSWSNCVIDGRLSSTQSDQSNLYF